jgi:hypothetical protein
MQGAVGAVRVLLGREAMEAFGCSWTPGWTRAGRRVLWRGWAVACVVR